MRIRPSFLPLLSGILLFIIGFSFSIPYLPLISLFHWRLYRPDLTHLLPYWILGCIEDVARGAYFGETAFVYFVSAMLIQSIRRFLMSQTFVWQWFFFIVGFGVSLFLKTLLLWLVMGTKTPYMLSIMESILLTFLYPVLIWGVIYLHSRVPHPVELDTIHLIKKRDL